ncbi:MAG: hypothetical protein Kow00124_16560 [Anaerolineae bacterium]
MASIPASGRIHPFRLVIDEAACRLCRRCLASGMCRGKAFVRFGSEEPPYIDMARCHGCLACMSECPFGAIRRIDGSGSSTPSP